MDWYLRDLRRVDDCIRVIRQRPIYAVSANLRIAAGGAENSQPGTGTIGGMVPLNPATQQGIYPSSGANSPYFDPYNTRPSYQVPLPSTTGPSYPPAYGSVAPYGNTSLPGTAPTGMFGNPSPNPNVYSGAPFNMNGSLPATNVPSTVIPMAATLYLVRHYLVLPWATTMDYHPVIQA